MTKKTKKAPRATDSIILEVQKIKDKLARKFNYDVRKIAMDARSRQGSSGHKVVSFNPDTCQSDE